MSFKLQDRLSIDIICSFTIIVFWCSLFTWLHRFLYAIFNKHGPKPQSIVRIEIYNNVNTTCKDMYVFDNTFW